jgi:organic hydroperoxide reductase OsmC/OhrA
LGSTEKVKGGSSSGLEVLSVCPDEIESHEFKVAVTWSGENLADITLESRPSLPLSSPQVFGGQPGCYTPQELFISSITACYTTTFLSILRRMKQSLDSLVIEGHGVIERDPEGGWRFREVIVKMNIGIPNEESTAQISRGVELAKKYCMVTRAVSCPVHLEHTINGQTTPI